MGEKNPLKPYAVCLARFQWLAWSVRMVITASFVAGSTLRLDTHGTGVVAHGPSTTPSRAMSTVLSSSPWAPSVGMSMRKTMVKDGGPVYEGDDVMATSVPKNVNELGGDVDACGYSVMLTVPLVGKLTAVCTGVDAVASEPVETAPPPDPSVAVAPT